LTGNTTGQPVRLTVRELGRFSIIHLTEVPLPAWQTLDPSILADVMILSWEAERSILFFIDAKSLIVAKYHTRARTKADANTIENECIMKI
jgi:hypothetical protein